MILYLIYNFNWCIIKARKGVKTTKKQSKPNVQV
jgi:hypothetical protein